MTASSVRGVRTCRETAGCVICSHFAPLLKLPSRHGPELGVGVAHQTSGNSFAWMAGYKFF